MAVRKERLRYIVCPHPDDEFSAWSLVQRSTVDYPVFVLLTRGEQTGMGDGHGLEAELGELVPEPQPFTGKGSENLKRQRVWAFHGFLDDMADVDETLDRAAWVGTVDSPAGPFDLHVGERSGRAVFDLGDGRLTADSVTAAIQAVRAVRAEFPIDDEHAVVGASYWNAHHAGALIATHPDHRAIHEALWHTHQGTDGPQWCRTASTDPDAADRGFVAEIDEDLYEVAMAVDPPPIDPGANPGASRTGAMQRWYGWLAFDPGGYWRASETDAAATTPFTRRQSFWERF